MAAVLKRPSKFFGLVKVVRCLTNRPDPVIDRIIRVDHAGEYGADRIYAGQVAVLGDYPTVGPLIKVNSISVGY